MRYTYCSYQLPSETCSISLCKRLGDSANGVLPRPRGESQERQLWQDRNQLVINRIAKMVNGYPDEIAAFLSDLTLQNYSSLMYPKGTGWSACNVPLCHPYVCDRYMGIFDNRGNLRDPTHPWSLNRLLYLLQRSLNGQPLGGDSANVQKTGDSASSPKSGDPRSGDPRSGDARSGDPRSGDPRSGDPSSGDPRSGDPRSGDSANISKSKSQSGDRKRTELRAQQNALPEVPATAGFAGTKRLSLDIAARRGSILSNAPGLSEMNRTQDAEGYFSVASLFKTRDQLVKGNISEPDSRKTDRKTEQGKDSSKGARGEEVKQRLSPPAHIEFDVKSVDDGYRVLHHVDSFRLSKDVYWLRKSQKAAEARLIIKRHVERHGNLVDADSLTNAIRRVKFDETPPKQKYKYQQKELARAISQMYTHVVEKKAPPPPVRPVLPTTPRQYVADQVPVLFHAPYEKDKPWTWQRRHPKQMRLTAENKIGTSNIKRYQRSSVRKELDNMRKIASIHSMFSQQHVNLDESTPAPMFGQKSKKAQMRSSHRLTITSMKTVTSIRNNNHKKNKK